MGSSWDRFKAYDLGTSWDTPRQSLPTKAAWSKDFSARTFASCQINGSKWWEWHFSSDLQSCHDTTFWQFWYYRQFLWYCRQKSGVWLSSYIWTCCHYKYGDACIEGDAWRLLSVQKSGFCALVMTCAACNSKRYRGHHQTHHVLVSHACGDSSIVDHCCVAGLCW